MFLHDTVDAKVKAILDQCGLDFRIHKIPMTTIFGSNEDGSDKVLDTPYFALVNGANGGIINAVKKSYTISQNKDIVEMIVKGVERFGSKLTVVDGGTFKNGARVFLKLAIEGDAKVGNDTIKRYVTIIDSNDGSSSLMVGIGDFTMSCKNQFYSFDEASRGRFRHTKTIEGKIKSIPTMIEACLEQSMVMMNRYADFQSTACSKNMAHKMVNHLLGFDKATMTKKEFAELSTRNENAMNSLYSNIENEMNSKGDNVWGLHSGVTRWTTHDKSAPKRTNGRVESLMAGTNYKVNQASMEFAMSLV